MDFGLTPEQEAFAREFNDYLDKHLERSGLNYEWFDIKQDLNNLKEITIDDAGKEVIIRTEARGTSSSIFRSLGMSLPPTIQKAKYDEM